MHDKIVNMLITLIFFKYTNVLITLCSKWIYGCDIFKQVYFLRSELTQMWSMHFRNDLLSRRHFYFSLPYTADMSYMQKNKHLIVEKYIILRSRQVFNELSLSEHSIGLNKRWGSDFPGHFDFVSCESKIPLLYSLNRFLLWIITRSNQENNRKWEEFWRSN